MTATVQETAEQLAEQAIRRALAADVTPDIRAIAERCALPVKTVEAIRDRLLSGKRPQPPTRQAPPPTYRPAPRTPAGAATPPAAPAGPPRDISAKANPANVTPGDDEELIAAGTVHPSATVRRLAKKAHDTNVRLAAQLDDLRAMIAAADAEAAEATARTQRIAALEAELAALRGPRPARTPKPSGGGPVVCGDCDWTGTGLAMHRRLKHPGGGDA